MLFIYILKLYIYAYINTYVPSTHAHSYYIWMWLKFIFIQQYYQNFDLIELCRTHCISQSIINSINDLKINCTRTRSATIICINTQADNTSAFKVKHIKCIKKISNNEHVCILYMYCIHHTQTHRSCVLYETQFLFLLILFNNNNKTHICTAIYL